jgi:hypothetical protein
MIPQTQRWWRGPVFDAEGEQTDEGGDCFAACIASLLELPIDGFPNFLDSRPLGNGGWWHKWQLWLYENYRAELLYWETKAEIPDPATSLVWWIAGVMCGSTSHSVLFYRDEFRWDPAPDGKKREWSLDDVVDAVALFSIASIFERTDGPYRALMDGDGNPIPQTAVLESEQA